jgi:adhesin transport system membrane fusion protein
MQGEDKLQGANTGNSANQLAYKLVPEDAYWQRAGFPPLTANGAIEYVQPVNGMQEEELSVSAVTSNPHFSLKEERHRLFEENLLLPDDPESTLFLDSGRGGRIILWIIVAFIITILIWSAFARVDEVTRGHGKVNPSMQLQVVQNLEGGIVSKILVKEGQVVDEGQVLLQIDNTMSSATMREGHLHYLAHKVRAARLKAEAEGTPFVPCEDVMKEQPELVQQEVELYESRQKGLQANLDILRSQAEQRQQELQELEVKLSQLQRSYDLLDKELKITKPLIKDGAISEVEVLRLERELSDLKGEVEATRLAIPRAKTKLDEANQKVSEEELSFRNKAREELTDTMSELSRLSESQVALADRVNRTTVRSPIHGTVKRIMINTVGGVVQPGMDLMEIVPLEDALVIEAKVKPADIAFIHPEQEAMVKFTAYDYSIYGGVKGHVEHISADTITDEQGGSYYLVRLRTEHNHLGTEKHPLKIIPGMTATVDILTGKKTVLEYLLKPILRAKEYAFRER